MGDEHAQLIKMTRSEPQFTGGPTTADVHPAEVENWERNNWHRAAESHQTAATNETEVVDLDSLDHDRLVELAASLKLGAPSTLRRWSDDRLRQEIADVSEKE